MRFSRQEYWSGLPFPFPGDLPDPGIEPRPPTLQADSLLTELQGKQSLSGEPQTRNCSISLDQVVTSSSEKKKSTSVCSCTSILTSAAFIMRCFLSLSTDPTLSLLVNPAAPRQASSCPALLSSQASCPPQLCGLHVRVNPKKEGRKPRRYMRSSVFSGKCSFVN